jgi:hypothetical protein
LRLREWHIQSTHARLRKHLREFKRLLEESEARSGFEQKLIQRIERARQDNVNQGLNPPEAGADLSFEFGRRIGYKQGMEHLIKHVLAFFADAEKDDPNL